MRLSVEGNTIEKMIVEVGQESRGRYFVRGRTREQRKIFCEREAGSRGREC